MEPFVTYPVEFTGKKSNVLLVILIGLVVLSTGIAVAMGYRYLATILFVAMIVLIVTAAFFVKGTFLSFDLVNKKLIITPAYISFNGVQYPVKDLNKLMVNVHSYKGLVMDADKRRNRRLKVFRSISDGMNNYLSFVYNDEKVNHRFYLNSKKHAVLLCDVFREWYKTRIPFVETDMNGQQTYLMQLLNEEELAEFKSKYGY